MKAGTLFIAGMVLALSGCQSVVDLHPELSPAVTKAVYRSVPFGTKYDDVMKKLGRSETSQNTMVACGPDRCVSYQTAKWANADGSFCTLKFTDGN